MDTNETAFRVVREATDGRQDDGKDPIAVELGRRGGLKGGRARAESMTAEQRSKAARHAALSRWRPDDEVDQSTATSVRIVWRWYSDGYIRRSFEEITFPVTWAHAKKDWVCSCCGSAIGWGEAFARDPKRWVRVCQTCVIVYRV